MILSVYSLLEATVLLGLSILWCEVGYYYYLFNYSCKGWPEPSLQNGSENYTRVLVLADTHIMGPIKSVRLDKWRREWQMKQAYAISNRIYEPELVLFLGDIFDEASFSREETFEKNCDDFDRIFPIDKTRQDRVIIPGNHDVGFHDQMINYPYLLRRFQQKYKSTASLSLMVLKNFNVVLSNSMSFYNDSCPFCSQSIAELNIISDYLDEKRKATGIDYSAPLLLTHIPLYRLDDTRCEYPSSLQEKVKKPNMEGEDVMHLTPSKLLVEKLKPRLILSGHTHMDCRTAHSYSDQMDQVVDELTISSYNHKYAEKRPSFLLMSINSKEVYTRHCYLVEEWIIMIVYIATFLIIITRLSISH